MHDYSLVLTHLPENLHPSPLLYLFHHWISGKNSPCSLLLPSQLHSHVDPLKFGSHYILPIDDVIRIQRFRQKSGKAFGFKQALG